MELKRYLRVVASTGDDDDVYAMVEISNRRAREAADRIEKLEAALREMLEKCTWAKREKWCGSLDCHCQIARKALGENDE